MECCQKKKKCYENSDILVEENMDINRKYLKKKTRQGTQQL